MRIALLSGACMASAMIVTASGATPFSAMNPTRAADGLNPDSNDATSIGDGFGDRISGSSAQVVGQPVYAIGDSIDYGLASMQPVSDDRSPRISGSNGHIASATDMDIAADDDQSLYDATTPAHIASALTATTDAGAFASG
jgi:hypothetical protein